MKKIVMILLATVMGLTLAACADNTELTENNGNIGSSQNAEDKSSAPSEAGNESEQPSKTPELNTAGGQQNSCGVFLCHE